jgi:AAA domain, putative AbiEii toxin, Type IV TA system/Domain of unknown function (DUF4365)/AAA domain
VLVLLSGLGIVWELKFGSWVLLQPERLYTYAQALIQTMRTDEDERGCIPEEQVLKGDLAYFSSVERLRGDEERFMLLAMHQTLVERGLCFREYTDKGPLLVFPSYYRRERPEQVEHPAVFVSYRFSGFLDDIYATLIVRLEHTRVFQRDRLWRYAADFTAVTGKRLGIKLTRRAEGTGEIEVYFDPKVPVEQKIIFCRYIHEHILQNSSDVARLRHYVCPHCGTPVANRETATRRLQAWLESQEPRQKNQPRLGDRQVPNIICVQCENRVPLWDEFEQFFANTEIRRVVEALQAESATVLDVESKERVLVGEVISTVALAGELCREFSVSDHGIDMEIEFRTNTGSLTGRKVYLQLKSGDRHLARRRRDGSEIFKIENLLHAEYWRKQRFPVLLLIRTGSGEIRWMDVRDYLRRESGNRKRAIRHITFNGQRFDVMSVRRWREDALQGYQDSTLEGDIDGGDEGARLGELRQLASAAHDDRTRDYLLRTLRSDPFVKVQAAAAEALSQGWWAEREVRRAVRMVAAASQGILREQFTSLVVGAKRQLADVWEAKLSGREGEQKDLETLPGYPAFRISKFRLRDIGPFHDSGEVELHRDVNVFLGDNAAGKTTILRSLALAAIGLPAANEVVNTAEAYLRKGSGQGSIEVLLELIPDPDAFPEEYGYFASGLAVIQGSSRFRPIPDREMTFQFSESPTKTNSVEHLGALRSKCTSQFGFVSAYGAVRTFLSKPNLLQGELGKGENEWVRSLFDSEAPLVHPAVLSKLIRGDTSNIEDAPPTGLSPELTQMLRASLTHLFPDVRGFLSDSDDDLQLYETPLRFGELSDGYRSLFALIGHLLRCSLKARNWKDDPSQIQGISLIDELDLHLHPAWQHHVVADFCKALPNVQLIASTHSPLVVGALKREHVLTMRREPDGSITVERPEFDPQGLGVAGILTNLFSLGSTIDQPTLDKITRRLVLYSKRSQWGNDEEVEYAELTDHLAKLGFSREFTDPYYELFATAMARRHKATLERLTPNEKLELDKYADQLLAEIAVADGK